MQSRPVTGASVHALRVCVCVCVLLIAVQAGDGARVAILPTDGSLILSPQNKMKARDSKGRANGRACVRARRDVRKKRGRVLSARKERERYSEEPL